MTWIMRFLIHSAKAEFIRKDMLHLIGAKNGSAFADPFFALSPNDTVIPNPAFRGEESHTLAPIFTFQTFIKK